MLQWPRIIPSDLTKDTEGVTIKVVENYSLQNSATKTDLLVVNEDIFVTYWQS
jgi:hypothetical protein